MGRRASSITGTSSGPPVDRDAGCLVRFPNAVGVFSESSLVRTLGRYDATRHSCFGEWRNDEATEVASRRGEPEPDITRHETVGKAWLPRQAPDLLPTLAASAPSRAPARRTPCGPGLRTSRLC